MSALNSRELVPHGMAYGGVSVSLDGNTVVFQGNSGHNQSNVYIYNRLTDTVSLLMPGSGNAHIDGSGHFITMEGHPATSQSTGVDVLLASSLTQNPNITASLLSPQHIEFKTGLINGAANVTVSLAVQNGSLALDPSIDTLHLTVTPNGNSLQISGALDAVNNALQTGIVYTGSGPSPDTLTISVDGGTFQSQGIQYPSQTLTFDAQGHTISSAAILADISGTTNQGDNSVWSPEINADGRYITFESAAQEIVINGHVVSDVTVNGTIVHHYQGNGQSQVYVYDQASGTVEVVSVTPGNHTLSALGTAGSGTLGDNSDWPASFSADGRYVTFQSDAALVGADTNGTSDVYVYDRVTHATERVSVGVTHTNTLTAPQNDFLVTGVAGIQNQSGIAATADGGFTITWTDNIGTHAVSYDHFGNKVGDVNPSTAGGQSTSAQLANGNVVVVRAGQDANQGGIFGQIYSAGGTTIRSEFAINQTTTGDQSAPSITALENGGFLVAWQSKSGSDYDIVARAFDTTGAPVTNDTPLNTTTAGDQTAPQLATLANGSVVAMWQDSMTGIHARIFSDIVKTQSTADSYRPEISPDGRYVVFGTDASLVSSDTNTGNHTADTYVYDRVTQTIQLVSHDELGRLGAGNETLGNAVSSGGVIDVFGGVGLAFRDGPALQYVNGKILLASGPFADLVAGDGALTMTLHVAHGSLASAGSVVGLTYVTENGVLLDGHNGTLKVTGRAAAISLATQAGVLYTPAGGASGADAMTIQLVDANGGSFSTSEAFNWSSQGSGSVTEVSPLSFAGGSAAVVQNGIQFSGLSLTTINPPDHNLTVAISVGHGTLTPSAAAIALVQSGNLTILNGEDGNGGTIEITGSLADINAALTSGLTYTNQFGGPEL